MEGEQDVREGGNQRHLMAYMLLIWRIKLTFVNGIWMIDACIPVFIKVVLINLGLGTFIRIRKAFVKPSFLVVKLF